MGHIELNWATAQVKDAQLTVELEGKPSSDWKQSFESTITLLPGGDWGEVELKKHRVRVSDVPPGSEAKLRHHLESVVEQANADVRPAETQDTRRSSEGDDHEEDEADSPDARMTESFRAFASDESPPPQS